MVIFAVLGLVVDIGWAQFRQRAAQAAADGAALAAVANAVASSPCNPVCATNGVLPERHNLPIQHFRSAAQQSAGRMPVRQIEWIRQRRESNR